METKLMRVTPPIARDWLKRNVNNRHLRPSTVLGIKSALERGEYVVTHQGIAFDAGGNLLDGQHRLAAIAQMPDGFGVDMLVTRGLEAKAFEAIDIGNKRSNADVLRLPMGYASCARFMAALLETHKSSITPHSLIPYCRGIDAAYARLIDYTPKNTKTWSSAAVRSAAILRMLSGGDMDYILLSYHALNHGEFDGMSKIVQSLYRQQTLGKIRDSGVEMFVRAFRAFDIKRQGVPTVQISDQSIVLAEARELVKTRVLGQKLAAEPVAAVARKRPADSKQPSFAGMARGFD